MEYLKKRHIIKLGEHFDFNGFNTWELMRQGTNYIYGHKYVFVKYEDYRQEPKSISDDLSFGIITILNIETGNGDIYNYYFFEICGDFHDVFNKGTKNAFKLFEFQTEVI